MFQTKPYQNMTHQIKPKKIITVKGIEWHLWWCLITLKIVLEKTQTQKNVIYHFKMCPIKRQNLVESSHWESNKSETSKVSDQVSNKCAIVMKQPLWQKYWMIYYICCTVFLFCHHLEKKTLQVNCSKWSLFLYQE